MRRLVVLLVLAALIAACAGALLVVRPSLVDKEAEVDEQWAPVVDALAPRHDALGTLAAAVADASDPTREVATEALDALQAWRDAVDDAADTEAQVALANRLEGLAARLAAAVEGSARLAEHEAVVDALDALTATVVPAGLVDVYNDAVRDYDDARRSITGQPVAALLGFEARTELVPVRR